MTLKSLIFISVMPGEVFKGLLQTVRDEIEKMSVMAVCINPDLIRQPVVMPIQSERKLDS